MIKAGCAWSDRDTVQQLSPGFSLPTGIFIPWHLPAQQFGGAEVFLPRALPGFAASITGTKMMESKGRLMLFRIGLCLKHFPFQTIGAPAGHGNCARRQFCPESHASRTAQSGRQLSLFPRNLTNCRVIVPRLSLSIGNLGVGVEQGGGNGTTRPSLAPSAQD